MKRQPTNNKRISYFEESPVFSREKNSCRCRLLLSFVSFFWKSSYDFKIQIFSLFGVGFCSEAHKANTNSWSNWIREGKKHIEWIRMTLGLLGFDVLCCAVYMHTQCTRTHRESLRKEQETNNIQCPRGLMPEHTLNTFRWCIALLQIAFTNSWYCLWSILIFYFRLFCPRCCCCLLPSAESVDVYRTQACMTQWNVNAWKHIWIRQERERETRSINEMERILLNEAAAEAADVIEIKER